MSTQPITRPKPSPSSLAGTTACLTTVLIWSGNVVVTKAAAGVIAPSSIAFYRWLLALVVLLPFVATSVWRDRAVAARYWTQLLALGLLGMVVYQSLAYEAAESTSAVNMGVILALMPLFSTLLASGLASERLTAVRLVGGLVSFCGLVYLTSRGDPMSLATSGVHAGDVLMLVAVLSNSLYGVMLKRWTIPLTLWQQLFWQILFSTLVLAPVWLAGPMSPVTAANLPMILYAAIPTSLVAPLSWMVGIRILGPGRTALFINLLPIVVTLLAWSILHEPIHDYHLIGGGIALFGVMIGLREPRIAAGAPDAVDEADGAVWGIEEV